MLPDNFRPIIPANARPYLEVQQGRIASLVGKPGQWDVAYRENLLEGFEQIDKFIPRPCASVLDIGGGMGGFDALLAQLQPGLQVAILDGFSDPPKVPDDQKTYGTTSYSCAAAADEFLRANGVDSPIFLDPKLLPSHPPKFDLILSIQSWGFHYPPNVYMKFALKASHPGTVWILDVRVMTRFWASDLFSQERLEPIGEAEGFTDKYTRMAFKVVK